MPLENLEQRVAALLIVPGERRVVVVGKPERHRARFLQRRRRADGEEVVHFADRAAERRR